MPPPLPPSDSFFCALLPLSAIFFTLLVALYSVKGVRPEPTSLKKRVVWKFFEACFYLSILYLAMGIGILYYGLNKDTNVGYWVYEYSLVVLLITIGAFIYYCIETIANAIKKTLDFAKEYAIKEWKEG